MNKFEIRKVADKSKGLVSLVHWDANQVILKLNGKLLTKESLTDIEASKIENLLQVDRESYLDLSGDLSFFVRHSCNANTTVKIIAKNAFLISTRAIKPNEELTFDYSMTATDSLDEWKMNCYCGSWNCRKLISGFNSLPSDLKETYIKKDVVPSYIKKLGT